MSDLIRHACEKCPDHLSMYRDEKEGATWWLELQTEEENVNGYSAISFCPYCGIMLP